jgi:hypothetical protein
VRRGAATLSRGSSPDWDDFAAHVSGIYDQLPHSDRQFEPSRSRAAGIEIDHAATRLLLRDVAVPIDHDAESGRFRLQIKLRQVMQDVDGNTAELGHLSLVQFASPGAFIDIAADRGDRRNRGEFVEYFGSANVASMNDVPRSTEC